MRGTGCKASTDAGLARETGVHDLNFRLSICNTFGFGEPGVKHERGQDTVCASDVVRAVEDLRAHHRPSWWRFGCAYFGLRRLVSRNGVLPIDMARVLARHRGLSDVQSIQAVSHGVEWCARQSHALGRFESEGLAHLSRTGYAPDRSSPRPLQQRFDRSGRTGR